ncbi:MAG TPA: MbtH family protein [Pyrinomonadaceae bacterium]|nr:MbtH family protein [Pyrinomonadaceae bacterium]
MSSDEDEDQRVYKVVVNHEEQYSIWPADRGNPLGWNDVVKSGSKAECFGIHQRSLDGHAAAQPA